MSTSYYLQLIVTLSIMAALLYIVLLYARTWRQKRFSGDIKIIDRLPIDTHSTLLIVAAREQEYFISISGKELTVIEKYPCSS